MVTTFVFVIDELIALYKQKVFLVFLESENLL